MSGYTFETEKDVAELLDYSIDYTNLLNGSEPYDVLNSSEWRVEGPVADLTIVKNSHSSTVATVYVSGGSDTNRYRLINRVTTVGGRTFERTILVESVVK
jgi:hypothetical protein